MFTSEIQAVRSLEAEVAKAWEAVDDADLEKQYQAQKEAEELESQLDWQKGELEAKVFEWVVGHPDFTDPAPDAPEKTPEYMQAAAELLRDLTEDELLLSFADKWENPTPTQPSRW